MGSSGAGAFSLVLNNKDFVCHFKESEAGKALAIRKQQSHITSLSMISQSRDSVTSWKDNEVRRYQTTPSASFVICLRREATLLLRDRSYLLARLMQDIFLGLLTGFLYWNISAGYASTIFGAM